MSPKKARHYFAEYRNGTLDASTNECMARLLDADSNLRAEYEADCRLTDLIALKRYEQPRSGAFDTFLAEFHRRQRLAVVQEDSFLAQFRERLHDALLFPARSLVGTGAVAALLALALGLSLFYSPNHGGPRSDSARAASSESPRTALVNAPVILANTDIETPASYVLPRINGDSGSNASGPNIHAPSSHGFTQFEF